MKKTFMIVAALAASAICLGFSLHRVPETNTQATETKDILELTPSEISNTFDFSPEAQRRFKADPDNEMFSDIYDILGEGCSFYCACERVKPKASSFLPAQGRMNYVPGNCHDLQYNTAWVEGKADDGIGEWIEYTFPTHNPPLQQIIIVNGYVRTMKTWTENSRVKDLELSINGRRYAMLHLEDVYASQTFDVDDIETGGRPLTLRFTIRSVYPGTKYKDTAISEIYFNGPSH